MVTLLPGVQSATIDTARLRTHYLESGPADGVPVVLVHGNLSSARVYEHLMTAIPQGYRVIAPDMRGFGGSAHLTLDATRGLADWADDVAALLDSLGVAQPPHLVGWSAGGGAITRYAIAGRPVASLTLIDPVGPFGFCGTHADGRPWFDDYAGSGGGIANSEFTARMASRDRSTESPFSPCAVMTSSFLGGDDTVEPERRDVLLEEMLKTWVGEDNFPGDVAESPNWPGIAPGTTGILNALSPKYCRWTEIVDLEVKPPVLWAHGSEDPVVSDASTWDPGVLGAAGLIAGWPGADVCPAQPMVTQTRDVLRDYADTGGYVRTEWLDGAHHLPLFECRDRWLAAFVEFLDTAERVNASRQLPSRAPVSHG